MKLTEFRVQMYKGVIDSGVVAVDDLTVLVGKNEAGKTTLLKALHKLNPATPDPYVIEREWPRGRRADRSRDQVVCTALFKLDAVEIQDLRDLTDQQITIDSLKVTRNYAGKLEVLFPDGMFPERIHPNDIDAVCEGLPNPELPMSETFQTVASKVSEEMQRLVRDGLLAELATLPTRFPSETPESYGRQASAAENERRYVTELRAVANQVLKESMRAKAYAYVAQRMPKFIYMDDYRTFRGSAILNQVKERVDQEKPSNDDETLLMVLKLSGLDLSTLVAAGSQNDRELRQYDLDDGGRTLTNVFGQRLKQREYEVQFRADGQSFYTMVKDKSEVGLLKLEERSKGFQWFFSFDMLFMHESGGTFQNCVVLLDEPGLHLHPGAQTDLLARLEEYAKGNTLIYSTHLPFMLDLRHPERIRVINESDNGAVVSEDLTKSQPEAKLTLQAALGMSGSSSYLLAQRNVVVEGVDDYMVVSALSELLARSGLDSLPEDVMVTAGGGASEAAYIATFMIGQQLDVVVLLDSDGSGEVARDKLVKSWLTKYKGKESQVLCLGETLDVKNAEFAIEDLFPDDFYLARVREVYAKQLSANDAPELQLVGAGQLCKRVERALVAKGINYNKGSVAKLIRRDLSRMKGVSELPPTTKDHAVKLIAKLTQALS